MNKAIRVGVWCFFALLKVLVDSRLFILVVTSQIRERRLKRKFGVQVSTPVKTYEELRDDIKKQLPVEGFFIQTSGSSRRPKDIVYTRKRVKKRQAQFIADLVSALGFSPGLKTLFVFGSVKEDSSLTSAMLKEKGPNRVELLQAPYRSLFQSPLRDYIGDYGVDALRAFVIAVSRPRYFYSTNPSTLWRFIQRLEEEPERTLRFLNDFLLDRLPGDRDAVERLARRIQDGAQWRALKGASKLSLEDLNPKLLGFVSWDGGYTSAYVERILSKHPKLKFTAMSSMSTETPQTRIFGGKRPAIDSETLYEFREPDSKEVLSSRDLIPGKEYVMIVSDEYGLLRYDTGDVFLCESKLFGGILGGAPSLKFRRREGLCFSFTGEKLTDQQVLLAKDYALGGVPCSLVPGAGEKYHLFLFEELSPDKAANLARKFDKQLRLINGEYEAKRADGRLGEVEGRSIKLEDFVRFIAGEEIESWESQFKLLPLYPYQRTFTRS